MNWNNWEDYSPRPLRTANGIKPRMPRGKFGESWWAGRWIAALEHLVNEGRLARGRYYARRGQVIKLEVGTDGIYAEVQGSRRTPYTVHVRFRTLSDEEWERVIDAMAARAIYAAKLLSGVMPEDIEQVFAEAGASLFPAQTKDLRTDCSCPDWSNPCKHVAAVHYLLGERFDEDPFLMFELRGRTKDMLLAALRSRRGVAPIAATPSDTAQEDEPEPEMEAAEPLPVEPAAFWSDGSQPEDLALSFEAPQVDALPIKRLGSPPFWPSSQDFDTLMERLYRAVAEHAYTIATGVTDEQTGATLPP
jgi:uncharacterized Zn finger protein